MSNAAATRANRALARLVDGARLIRYCAADAARYARLRAPVEAGAEPTRVADHLECRVRIDMHRLEKGLALRKPRRPFGLQAMARMASFLPAARRRGVARGLLDEAAGAVAATEAWNSAELRDETVSPAGEAYPGLNAEVREEFFASRRSVRDFDTDRPVPMSVVRQAVELARATPSVCGRQGFRIHWYSSRAAARLLELHTGSTGFAETIPSLGVVTARTRLFTGAHERNQRWIDGGLFAMTLVWAFHSLGVASCMLNWSRSGADSRRLRQAGRIPNDEDIVVLIGCGYPRAGHHVTRATRREVGELLVEHPDVANAERIRRRD